MPEQQPPQQNSSFIVTVLGPSISQADLDTVTETITNNQFTIDATTQLSVPSNDSQACFESSISHKNNNLNITDFKQNLLSITENRNFDIVLQTIDIYQQSKRLAVFDMDSTLIKCEVMDELAKRAGVGDAVAAITASAMRGEIPFNESFERRLMTLKGLDESILQDIAETLPMMEGAGRLLKNLKHLGYNVAILSGGFSYFANYLKEQYNLDTVYANELDIVDGKLTGKVKGEIVNGEMKAELLTMLAKDLNISLDQTIAVGDGANDLPMLALAGLGVAFHAKPIVKQKAKHAISTIGLDGLLYLLGIHDKETV